MTLRSYVELLRLEDVLRSHRFYKKAAHCAINVYLRLYDKPLKDTNDLNDGNPDNLDPSELKKLRNKQRKAAKKAEMEKQNQEQKAAKKEAHNKAAQKKNNEEEVDSPAKDDLVPEKLQKPEDPLGEAIKFLVPLQLLASNCLDPHLFSFEIYYRKNKPLLMLQSIKRALKVDPTDPRVHSCVVRLQKFVETSPDLASPVKQVLGQETQSIFTTKTAKERNEQFIQKHRESQDHRVQGAKMQVLLDPSNTESAVQLVTKVDGPKVSLQTSSEVFDLLKEGDFGPSGQKALEAYRKSCHEIFPSATKFSDQHHVNNNSVDKSNKKQKNDEIEP